MSLAVVWPWWALVAAAVGIVIAALAAYRRAVPPLTEGQRAALVGLRVLVLSALVVALLRPVRQSPSAEQPTRLLPVVVDVSGSMGIPDAPEGKTRLDAARTLVRTIESQLTGARLRVEVWPMHDGTTATDVNALRAEGTRSDLAAAIDEVAGRALARDAAAVVLVSDGVTTDRGVARPERRDALPLFTMAVGGAQAVRDLDVVRIEAGTATLPGSAIDILAVVVARGMRGRAVTLRLSENGRPVDSATVTPDADVATIPFRFVVTPPPDQPTVYATEVQQADAVPGNDRRQVLVPPQMGQRRVLLMEGAPGFEHTFLKRALATDTALSVDALVRKGRDDQGRDTFAVQATEDRASVLAQGFPSSRETLFQYDAVVLSNVEAEFFTRAQLELVRQFVAERGGGLLVMGSRSFEREGMAATPIADVLPVDPAVRRWQDAAADDAARNLPANAPAVTRDGATHSATRLSIDGDDSAALWRTFPPLASVSSMGAPRPGAQVLAVTANPGGQASPLIVMQRFGQGRSLVFAGEAAWRWRMMRPSSDTAYATVWRQMIRALVAPAPGPVIMRAGGVAGANEQTPVLIDVRDARFLPVTDAEVRLTAQAPDGRTRSLQPVLSDAAAGRYAVVVPTSDAGVWTLTAEAVHRGVVRGTTVTHLLIPPPNDEFTRPEVNLPALRRLADAAGGQAFTDDTLPDLIERLRRLQTSPARYEDVDLWHNVWTLAGIIALLATEWTLRRHWGML
ncbi:MAG: hypothetical protein FJW29_08090 [Acidobacteria bacterium]|nr:hypothetical protein [Acidobacteriota bacterium]